MDHHFFVSSFDIWTVGDDLFETLLRHKQKSKARVAQVYKVPGPLEQVYDINFYAPQVEGTELIDAVGLTATARKQLAADRA